MPKAVSGKRKGKVGEKAVRRCLKKYCAKNGCRKLDGIYLPLYNGCCEVDHLLFGNFGVAVIETKNIGGTLAGRASDTYLTHTIGSKTHRLYNPLLQNKTHCDNVRHHLSKAGFRNIPLQPFVVFTDETLKMQNSALGIQLPQLESALNRLPAGRCDPEALYQSIRRLRVRNPIKKWVHNLKIKFKKST